jgi:hypothetical protein
MKVGDTVPVNIGAATVTNAKIVELGDGTATLVIPATKVVMGVRTQLDTAPTPTGGTEHAILGVEPQAPSPINGEQPEAQQATPALPVDGVTPPADANEAQDGEPATPAVTENAPVEQSAVQQLAPVEGQPVDAASTSNEG